MVTFLEESFNCFRDINGFFRARALLEFEYSKKLVALIESNGNQSWTKKLLAKSRIAERESPPVKLRAFNCEGALAGY